MPGKTPQPQVVYPSGVRGNPCHWEQQKVKMNKVFSEMIYYMEKAIILFGDQSDDGEFFPSVMLGEDCVRFRKHAQQTIMYKLIINPRYN